MSHEEVKRQRKQLSCEAQWGVAGFWLVWDLLGDLKQPLGAAGSEDDKEDDK